MSVAAGAYCVDRWTPREPRIATADAGPDVCFALSVIRETVLRDRVPSPFATPEEVAAVNNLNEELGSVRRTLSTMNGLRQLNCPNGR